MTTQFRTTAALDELSHPYPKPEALRRVLLSGERRDREAIARLWLSEGLPFAFRNHPAIFETIRVWLSKRIDVDPKEITMIGSARIGYSLAGKQFGRLFQDKSDLDFTIISETLLVKLVGDFECFKGDYDSGKIRPKNENEKRYWPENISVCEENLKGGFLDARKIPNYDLYPTAQNVNNSMSLLVRKIERLEELPKIRKASARIYKNWEKFVNQCTLEFVKFAEDHKQVAWARRHGLTDLRTSSDRLAWAGTRQPGRPKQPT